MKFLCSVLMLLLFAICAAAQNAPAWPDVTVLENKWRVDVWNPALEKDVFSANTRQLNDAQIQGKARVESDNRVKQGEPALPPVVKQPPADNTNRKLSISYIYEVKVKNNGPKEIRSLIWDYLFFERGTTDEVGRRRFVSRVRIKPGATKQIVLKSPKSPTGGAIVDATKAGKKPSEMYSGQVLIRNISYADGSNWPVLRGR